VNCGCAETLVKSIVESFDRTEGHSIVSVMEVRRRNKVLKFMASGDAKARKLFPAWLQDTEKAEWHNTMDVKRRHGTADFLRDNRVVFNLGGNTYRIVTVIDYERQVVLIRWAGYHKDYERIDAATI
jgi:mRNA interferase HigB